MLNNLKVEEAVNKTRRKEKIIMLEMGFKTKKQYRKWQKKKRAKNKMIKMERNKIN